MERGDDPAKALVQEALRVAAAKELHTLYLTSYTLHLVLWLVSAGWLDRGPDESGTVASEHKSVDTFR